ncbi:MAG: DoxX family protein [Gemmatimonadaceae bacterium]
MKSQNSSATQWAHVALRIFAGAILCQHGAQKLFGVLGGTGSTLHAPVFALTLRGIAGPLEFLGGLLIIVGLFTHVVSFILSGEMAAVYFLMHSPSGFWPIENHGELPVILCFVFLYIAATGAGIFSLDYLRNRNRPTAVMG